MAIQYNFLAPIDQKVRDQGYDFVSQNKYLDDSFKPTSGISYEGDGSPVSYANSGIMSGYMTPPPIIYPPVNQGGDGGGGNGPPGGPAVDNSQFDYETEAYGIDPEYGLTEEEQEALDASIEGPQLGKLGTLGTIAGMFAAPLTTIGFLHRRNKKKQEELDAAVVEAGIQADLDRNPGLQGNDGTPGFGITAQGNFVNQFEGGDPGTMGDTESQTNSQAGVGGFHDYAKGGRAGYFFGGRVNYKAGGRVSFKNGGLASIL